MMNVCKRFTLLRKISLPRKRTVRTLFEGSSLNGVTFRHATEADIDGIVALSKLAHRDWYQIDYLPGWLPKVLTDPNRTTSIAVRNGEIMNYVMSLVGPDDGETVLFEAGRTHPDVMGTGVLGATMVWNVARLTAKCPGWKQIRASTIHANYYNNNITKFKSLTKRMYLRICLPYNNSFVSRLSHIQPREPVATSRLNPEEFKDVLSDKALLDHIYSNDLMYIGYNIFQPRPSNVQYVTQFHPNVFVNNDGFALSVGGQFPCDDEKAWRYNFNFAGGIDMNTCFEHLTEHLTLCFSHPGLPKEEVHLIVLLPTSFRNFYGEETVMNVFKEFLGVERQAMSVRDLHIFEYI